MSRKRYTPEQIIKIQKIQHYLDPLYLDKADKKISEELRRGWDLIRIFPSR